MVQSYKYPWQCLTKVESGRVKISEKLDIY